MPAPNKGVYYNETYSYWIENETLFVSLGGWETSHPIQEAENDKVVIGNKYLYFKYLLLQPFAFGNLIVLTTV